MQRGYRFDHPVIMLDADTGHIDPNTNEVLAQAVMAPDSGLMVVHADTISDVEGISIPLNAVEAEFPDGLDDATKLSLVAEISRRFQLARDRKKYDIPNMWGDSYPEEWGAAVALGPAIMVGNYNARNDNSEMMGLQMRLSNLEPEVTEAVRRVKPGLSGQIMPLAHYLPEVRVSASGRRWEQVLRDWVTLPEGVDNSEHKDNVRHWHLSGPTGLYDTREQFGHTDKIRQPTNEGSYNARDEVRETRMLEIIDAMLGETERTTEMVSVLQRFKLPIPISWHEGASPTDTSNAIIEGQASTFASDTESKNPKHF
jgi:hypothetical protein